MDKKNWEYRVVRSKSKRYSIQEVYFNDDGEPLAQTIDLQVEGPNLGTLGPMLGEMCNCLKLPVLDEEDIVSKSKITERGVPFSSGGVYNNENNYTGPEGEYLEKIGNDGRGNDIYIYESPDGGQTIYRREFGKDEREKM